MRKVVSLHPAHQGRGVDDLTNVFDDIKKMACVFAPHGKTIVSASWDKTLKIWDVELGTCLTTLKGHRYLCLFCAIAVGKTVKVTILPAALPRSAVERRRRPSHMCSLIFLWACKFAPDGKTVVSASEDKTLKIWNVAWSGRTLSV